MRNVPIKLLVALLLAASTFAPAQAQRDAPNVKMSPPGQVTIVSVNAHQFPILGIKRFRAMYELSRALRRRPLAFDGGFFGAVQAPDVIVLQEIRPSNAEIFEHILRQRYQVKYEIITSPDMAATLIVHPNNVARVGEVTALTDACSLPGDDRYPTRQYPVARFLESETEAPFAVVGIHFPKGGQGNTSECLQRNVDQLRMLFEAEQTPTILAGDFNRRPVREPLECDENEATEPLPWYAALTAPDNGGRQYVDAVRDFNRTNSILMSYEWTHEQKSAQVACTGNIHHRRSRIDFIFTADAAVAEAHADHPGWAGEVPGTRHEHNHKYSDHRWVWSRIVLSGPPRPERPRVAPDAGGVIHVSWAPVEGATGYVVYRAQGSRAFGVLARVGSDVTNYDDTDTIHGRSFRYIVAATGPDNGQGIESRGDETVADARGPRVIAAYPAPGATGVGPGQAISARFDENVPKESVGQDSIRLFVNGHPVRGVVIRKGPRLLKFNPRDPLRKGQAYTAVVPFGLQDKVGNEGKRFSWRFRTEAPPPKKARRRRR